MCVCVRVCACVCVCVRACAANLFLLLLLLLLVLVLVLVLLSSSCRSSENKQNKTKQTKGHSSPRLPLPITSPPSLVHCCCQTLFQDREFREKHRLAAVNSINWARILAQVCSWECIISNAFHTAPHTSHDTLHIEFAHHA